MKKSIKNGRESQDQLLVYKQSGASQQMMASQEQDSVRFNFESSMVQNKELQEEADKIQREIRNTEGISSDRRRFSDKNLDSMPSISSRNSLRRSSITWMTTTPGELEKVKSQIEKNKLKQQVEQKELKREQNKAESNYSKKLVQGMGQFKSNNNSSDHDTLSFSKNSQQKGINVSSTDDSKNLGSSQFDYDGRASFDSDIYNTNQEILQQRGFDKTPPKKKSGADTSPTLREADPMNQFIADEIMQQDRPNRCFRLWQRFENYMWMNDHHFFYICCIHEYCWNRCFKTSSHLVTVRAFLCLTMLALCVAEVLTFNEQRFVYFSNWGVYLTTIVSILQFTCSIKYKLQLDSFNIKLKNIHDNLNSTRDYRQNAYTDEEDTTSDLSQSRTLSNISNNDRKSRIKSMNEISMSEQKDQEDLAKTSAFLDEDYQENALPMQISVHSSVMKRNSQVRVSDLVDQQGRSESIWSKKNVPQTGLTGMIKDLEMNSMIYMAQAQERSTLIGNSFLGTGPGEVMNTTAHDNEHQVDKSKYSPFHLYKWTTILYEMAVVYELIIIPLFWTVIFPGFVRNRHNGRDLPDIDDFRNPEDAQALEFVIVAGVLDHSVPLIVLMIDFSYNCIPFVWRHFLITLAVAIVYMIFNVVYSIVVDAIYPMVDYSSALGILFPLLGLLWTLLMYYTVIHVSKHKLKKSNKNIALVQLSKIKDMIKYQKQVKQERKQEHKRRKTAQQQMQNQDGIRKITIKNNATEPLVSRVQHEPFTMSNVSMDQN